jgi:hypothetical protein
MEEVIEPGAVEHGVVSKVVLQPARLSLRGAHTHGSYDPSGPCVAKVPEHPPTGHLKEDNVSKKGHKEPRVDFEISLQITSMNNDCNRGALIWSRQIPSLPCHYEISGSPCLLQPTACMDKASHVMHIPQCM